MPIVLIAAVLVALVWGAIAFRRFSPVGVAVATIAIGYVFGHGFWNVDLGPLPLTVDRLLLFVLVATIAWYAWQGRIEWRGMLTVDWFVVALLALLTVSCVVANVGGAANLPTSPYFRLIFSFWTPALLYFAVRLAPLSTRTTNWVLGSLTLLGTYLAVTACAEITGQWWAVFPKYLADPTLGTHFGRARGPALNSVSLGNYLAVAFWATWTLRPRVSRSWQLVLIGCMSLMVLAILFTFTRSVWLGLSLSGFVMLVAHTPREFRWPVAIGTAVSGVVLAAIGWSFVLNLNREDSGQVSRHSAQQRTAFAYVSWNMLRDEPLTGVGFGRFYDKKLPYLSDRSQPFELESLRGLHHHNTLLSLAVETGLAGLATYVSLLVGWAAIGYRMAFLPGQPLAIVQMGRLLLAVLCVYLPSVLFHDLSHIFQDQSLLLLMAGLSVATAEQSVSTRRSSVARKKALSNDTETQFGGPALNPTTGVYSNTTSEASPSVSLFGMNIHRVNLQEATSRVLDWCGADRGDSCRYVVTPNVDHAVLLTHHEGLRKSYAGASMVLADGAPIVAASRLLGQPLPERVAGSDLVPSLLKAASTRKKPLRVFLLGAAPGVAERAAKAIHSKYAGVQVVGTHCPPLGFERNPLFNQQALDAVAAANADLLIVGLGAPKQELWVARHQNQLAAKVAVCAGATIDFLAGEKRRSPRWMQQVGLEWLHRLSTEPRRLASRYLRDALVFPQLVWNEYRAMGA